MSCNRRNPSKGFTLAEVMVVLVIIGLLAGVVTVNVRNYVIKGRQESVRMEIATICQALETFYSTYGRYPSNEEGVDILAAKTEKLAGPLLSQTPQDPWGRPYQYNQAGADGRYEVICYGADGREGGQDEDADISSANLKGN